MNEATKQEFLNILSHRKSILEASRRSRVANTTVYNEMGRDPEFRRDVEKRRMRKTRPFARKEVQGCTLCGILFPNSLGRKKKASGRCDKCERRVLYGEL